MFVTLNLVSVGLLTSHLPGVGLARDARIISGVSLVVGLWGAVLFWLHLAWIRSGRFLYFAREFESETEGQRRFRSVLVNIYEYGSIVLPGLVAYLIRDG